MSLRTIIASLAVTIALASARAAAPTPPPDAAPHGIANQAGEPERVPSATGPVAVPEPSEKAYRYARSGNWLWALDTVWGFAVPGLILISGFSAKLRDIAKTIGRNWFFTIVVYFLLFIAVTFVIGLPLSYYVGFVRPHAYDLSNQSIGKWFGDELKGLMVVAVFGSLVLWMPYRLIKKSPRRWWFWTWVLSIPIGAFVFFIAPIVIEPLFNNFGPMKDKVLERQILDLAGRAGIEGARVFEVDKSADTKTVNAYVTGLGGSKRIVLWDTTIAKLEPNQLLFVMGHEMGHYVLGHILKFFIVIYALLLLALYVLYRLQAGLIARFRERIRFTELSDVASFPMLLLLIGVLFFGMQPLFLGFSRSQEHEADRFGLEITRDNQGGASAFVRLQEENLSLPRRSAVYKFWRASHPLLGERIDFCNSYHPWTEGRPGRYEHLFH